MEFPWVLIYSYSRIIIGSTAAFVSFLYLLFVYFPQIVQSRIDFDLYKWVFPLECERPSIAIIGLTQSYGAIPPVYEMQARWAARVFTGQCQLPSPDARKKYWREKKKLYFRNFGGKTRVRNYNAILFGMNVQICEIVIIRPKAGNFT